MEYQENDLTINFHRFLENLNISSETGKVQKTGLYRLALTEEDKVIRDFFVNYMERLGLEVRIDDIGNIYGRKEGKENLPPVVIGSHLDTQPYGGRYNGVAGVLLSLEVIETLIDNNIETKRPIEVVNFTNEEGARFSPPMMASGILAGAFTKEEVYSKKDKASLSFGQELKRIGYAGLEDNRLTSIHSYVEPHIEQGPVLAEENLDSGIVTGIQGSHWFEIELTGESNHAATTPMENRKDALLAAAEIVNNLETMAEKYSIKLTIGKFNTEPNVPNVIPAKVNFTIDIRSDEDDSRKKFITDMKQLLTSVSDTRKVRSWLNQLWEAPTVHFDEKLIGTISEKADAMGLSSKKMISGAGHDARYINDLGPTAMIFMPSENGISHDIKEFTKEEHLDTCGNLLLKVVLELAGQ